MADDNNNKDNIPAAGIRGSPAGNTRRGRGRGGTLLKEPAAGRNKRAQAQRKS